MSDYTTTTPLNLFLRRHWVITLMLMVMCFVVFGAMSLKLVEETLANLSFIRQHGLLALQEGAIGQMLMLLGQAALAVLAYVGLKVCESALIQKLFLRR
jgi:hypothetical protein